MSKAHRLKQRSSGKALAVGFNFLLGASNTDLDSFELMKLATIADLRKELHGIFDRIITETSQAALARWFKAQDRQTLKHAIEHEESALEWARRMIRERQRKPEELIPLPSLEPGAAHRAAALRYQKRNLAEGKCRVCPRPIAPTSNGFCVKHLAAARDRKTPNRAAEPGSRGFLYGDEPAKRRGPNKTKFRMTTAAEKALFERVAGELGITYQRVRQVAYGYEHSRRVEKALAGAGCKLLEEK